MRIGEPPQESSIVPTAVQRIELMLAASSYGADAERMRLMEWLVNTRNKLGTDKTSTVANTLAHAGNYWGCCILLVLQHGPLRPSLILKILEAMQPSHAISQRMLTLDLRDMERNGLVERKILSLRRAHVEYRLTAEGAELSRRLQELVKWIASVAPKLAAARDAFDRQMEESDE